MSTRLNQDIETDLEYVFSPSFKSTLQFLKPSPIFSGDPPKSANCFWINIKDALFSYHYFLSFILFFILTLLPYPASLNHISSSWAMERETTPKIHQLTSYLKGLGIYEISLYPFMMPVVEHHGCSMSLTAKGSPSHSSNTTLAIEPFHYNAVSPESTPPQGLRGHLVFAGRGDIKAFNHWNVRNAIVLMDIHSGKNWLNAAELGAKGVIFYDSAGADRWTLQEKRELTPIHFPMFRMEKKELENFLNSGPLETLSPESISKTEVTLHSRSVWKRVEAQNLYAVIPGTDPELSKELIIVEAFYPPQPNMDPTSLTATDQGCSLSTLLDLAATLKAAPPARSVMLIATAGHDMALAGWREMIWSVAVKSKILKNEKKTLEQRLTELKEAAQCLHACYAGGKKELLFFDHLKGDSRNNTSQNKIFQKAISNRLATTVDGISRNLMNLRLGKHSQKKDPTFRRTLQPGKKETKLRPQKQPGRMEPDLWRKKQSEKAGSQSPAEKDQIKILAEKRLMIRQLAWRQNYETLSLQEKMELAGIIELTIADLHAMVKDLQQQLTLVKQAMIFRKQVDEKKIKAVISLHLSSHGSGFGAFNQGWLYPLKSRINRTSAYRSIDTILKNSAHALKSTNRQPSLYQDTLRPSRLNPWQSYFPDKPALGGEVSALAGLPGFTFATVHDARTTWGTLSDNMENMDKAYAARQSLEICHLIAALGNAPQLKSQGKIRNGFATVTGQCRRLLHGELFATHPAPDTLIFAFQGPGRYHAMSDSTGIFKIKGVADKKHVLDKVIIEGYRFNEDNGRVQWAIDKKQTGKPAYRLKMKRRHMSTDLILFNAKQTTLFNLMEPGNFHYMSRIELFDGRRDVLPLKYWYSRIDTRASILSALFVEPGTPLKVTLSDSVLKKKLILTNASKEHPQGKGYIVDQWPAIHNTPFQVAKDMWHLITPRIENLEKRGIFNEHLKILQQKGLQSLSQAQQALEKKEYDRFKGAAATSWALASKVYDDVEKTQKDVLFGVLFYIALFVPFAFCLERLLLGFTNIYKRISGFFIILILQITIIYNVHPAFQLAYSPVVIILAFFIIGLSLLVSLILFFRFEREMILLQRNATHMRREEISSFKAFTAAFHLGVSNLRRRRTRTALTCTTLVILTFTIMGFTTVKSIRLHTHTRLKDHAQYHGFLLKQLNWKDFPSEALGNIQSSFADSATIVPRVWLEGHGRNRAPTIPISLKTRIKTAENRAFLEGGRGERYNAGAVAGFSASEPLVTGIDSIITRGRWFKAHEDNAVLIPETMAHQMAVEVNDIIEIWGKDFKVAAVFDPDRLNSLPDLDGEVMTPAIFPDEIAEELSEVEMDAMESGEDVLSFESRYSHIPPEQTVIIPAATLLAAGGSLKGFAGKPLDPSVNMDSFAKEVADRFKLILFIGTPKGTFVYNAGDSLNYSGIPNIFIPLLISVLIVLNTMISSVYERKEEIGIYTSVGLAPSHVAFLFIAEAMAFAVISVVMGYLAAQTSAALFSHTALWRGITVNYSSTAGVGAMLLVMAVVMISVIYPAKLAARIAIPDINRTWKLPKPEGNRLAITLPFLMKYQEHMSIAGFLYSWFRGHRDYSHGIFSTGEVSAFQATVNIKARGDAGQGQSPLPAHQFACSSVAINSRVWLAPFDLGIMQQINITFEPSLGDCDYLQLHIELLREAGEADSWLRLNKRFLLGLRKQLLIWRSLNETPQNRYEDILQKEMLRKRIKS